MEFYSFSFWHPVLFIYCAVLLLFFSFHHPFLNRKKNHTSELQIPKQRGFRIKLRAACNCKSVHSYCRDLKPILRNFEHVYPISPFTYGYLKMMKENSLCSPKLSVTYFLSTALFLSHLPFTKIYLWFRGGGCLEAECSELKCNLSWDWH